MITVTKYNAKKIADIARKESGKAEFITLMIHDGEIKLNNPGELSIPSRTSASVALSLNCSQQQLIRTIGDFLRGVK